MKWELQKQIEELKERLAIMFEGQPEVDYALGVFGENYSITWPLTLIGTILLSTEVIGSAQTGNENDVLSEENHDLIRKIFKK